MCIEYFIGWTFVTVILVYVVFCLAVMICSIIHDELILRRFSRENQKKIKLFQEKMKPHA